jgi:kumamolisin
MTRARQRLRRGPVATLTALLIAGGAAACSGGSSASAAARVGDLGELAPDTSVTAVVGVRARSGDADAKTVLARVATPGSAQYGRYLSPGELVAGYGADPAAVSHVRSAFQRDGLRTDWQPGDGYVTVTGRAADMSRTFGTSLHLFRNSSGRTAYRPTAAPQVPRDLRTDATSVWKLSNDTLLRPFTVRSGGLTPADVLTVYNVRPLRDAGFDGNGETIIVYTIDGYRDSDLQAFAREHNLPPFEIEQHLIGGGKAPPPQGEATMDLEIVHAIAPGARLAVYTLTSQGSDADFLRLFRSGYEAHPRSVGTASFGACERALGPSAADYDAEFARAGALGVTLFASSGDSTGFDCYGNSWTSAPDENEVGVVFPASLPSVTGVGGTLLDQRSDGGYGREVTWHEPARTTGTGGGVSVAFPRPSWQQGPGVGSGGVTDGREVPDVSADADPSSGMAVVIDGQAAQGGGTSQAAPIWAGIATLVNSYLRAHSKPVLGFANPVLYRLASTDQPYPPFHDVTVGFNGVYSAGPGYDPVTGLGTPDAWNLARDVAALTDRS